MSLYPLVYSTLLIGILLSSTVVAVSGINGIYRIGVLILVFVLGANLLLTMEFNFIGLTYIIVYVGAIAILFLFVIMMIKINNGNVTTQVPGAATPRPILGPWGPLLNPASVPGPRPVLYLGSILSRGLTILVPAVPVLIGLSLVYILSGSEVHEPGTMSLGVSGMVENLTGNYYTYFFPNWYNLFVSFSDLQSIAKVLYIAYPFALIILGLALFAVMIGILAITAA